VAALKDISLTIHPGQRLGICGRTGRYIQFSNFYSLSRLKVNSGKSSLLLTLLRLLDPQSGTILIDGYDLSIIPREIIRNRFVAIPQDPFILSDTIRTNIDPLGTLPDDLLIFTLTKVHLWTTISARGGLNAQMKAQPLSQGQQQLFCLAKAMLRNSKILILDEATSNLDEESERWIQEVIREEFKGWTIVMVAHRMESVLEMDMVAVLDKGELMEVGTPMELLGREGGVFRGLNG
jgi:ATP-binding cassette, subfamily C (CFTR/MRP), member 1